MNTDMKKIFKLMSTAIAAIAFNACSDVPAPYEIKDNGTGGDTSTYISESFSNGFGSFSVKTVKGIDWVIDYSTAKASGYNNSDKTNTASDSYLVSKTIDLSASTGAYLEFEYILRYASSGTNKVLITDSYTNDPATTNWTDITGKLTEGSDWTTFEKYSVNIPAEFIGKNAVNIAFHYTATDANSATWEVKNVKLKEGQAEVVPDTPDVPGDGGTRDNPFDVATAKSSAQGKTGWVKGYIVGWVNGQTYSSGATFSVPTEAQTEILLAATADETNADNCMPVQLPAGDIRTALELFNNPSLYKKEILLYGSFEKYFGIGGLKSTSAAIVDGKLIGKDPDSTEPDTPGTGDGKTKTTPYSVAQAITNQGSSAWVTGYIVGYVNGTKIQDGATFAIPEAAETEILIADSQNETNYTKCIPVQLPAGEIRNSIELFAHKEYYKKQVTLYGSLEKYFGVSGLKSTSVAIIEGTQFGTDPK